MKGFCDEGTGLKLQRSGLRIWLCTRAFVWPRAGSSWHPGAALQGMGGRQDVLDMEHGSVQGSVAPRYPSLLTGRRSSSPPEPKGTELHPAGTTADANPGLSSLTSIPLTCSSSCLAGEKTHSSSCRCHPQHPQTPHSSTHSPLVECGGPFSSVPSPGVHPNCSNIPVTLP